MTTKEFLEQVKKNNWETYTSDQIASFVKDEVFNKSLSEEDREVAAIEYSSLKKQEVVNEDMTKSIFYYRESQIEWDKTEDGTLMKARSGVYKDTPTNRRLKRVGQRYGSKKGEEPSASKESGEEKKITTSSTSKQAAAASDKQLQAAAKDKSASKEVRDAAQKELESRQSSTSEKKEQSAQKKEPKKESESTKKEESKEPSKESKLASEKKEYPEDWRKFDLNLGLKKKKKLSDLESEVLKESHEGWPGALSSEFYEKIRQLKKEGLYPEIYDILDKIELPKKVTYSVYTHSSSGHQSITFFSKGITPKGKREEIGQIELSVLGDVKIEFVNGGRWGRKKEDLTMDIYTIEPKDIIGTDSEEAANKIAEFFNSKTDEITENLAHLEETKDVPLLYQTKLPKEVPADLKGKQDYYKKYLIQNEFDFFDSDNVDSAIKVIDQVAKERGLTDKEVKRFVLDAAFMVEDHESPFEERDDDYTRRVAEKHFDYYIKKRQKTKKSK